MTTKHTPGPWTTTGPNVRADNGALVATAQDHWNDHKTPQEEKEANAQLIAAAPELLAALKNLLGYATGEWQPEDEASLAGHGIEPAWGAIAKAEGTPS